MRKKTEILIAIFLFCGLILKAADQNGRTYTETHGDRTSVIQYTVSRSGQTLELASSGGPVTDAIRWVEGTGTVWWKEIDTIAHIDIEGVRVGNEVHVTGTHKGAPMKRVISLDSAPWYQIFGPLVEELLPGLQGAREFWVVNPDDLASHKMLVRRIADERIKLGAALLAAVKLHFSPAGMLASFWGADFWYRPADSQYLYSRLPENGGLTITALVDPEK